MSVSTSTGVARSSPTIGGAMAAGLGAAALFVLPIRFPLVLVLLVLSPFPLVRERVLGGAGSAWSATILAAALVFSVASPSVAIAFVVPVFLPSLVMADQFARGRGLLRGCAWALGLIGLEVAVALFFWGDVMASGLAELFNAWTGAGLEQLKAGGLPAETLDELREQVGTYRSALAIVYPAIYAIGAALLLVINAATLRAYLARVDPGWVEGEGIESLRWPLGLAVAFVLSGGGVAIPPLRPLAYNALLLVAFLCALQGLAVVAFYVRRLAGPPVLRGLLMALVLINPWAPYALALLGLFDLFLDVRKWVEPRGEAEI